jgi:hypothetical protein
LRVAREEYFEGREHGCRDVGRHPPDLASLVGKIGQIVVDVSGIGTAR